MEQLRIERAKTAQANFNNAKLGEQLAIAQEELAEARCELAQRDVAETFARMACASPSLH